MKKYKKLAREFIQTQDEKLGTHIPEELKELRELIERMEKANDKWGKILRQIRGENET